MSGYADENSAPVFIDGNRAIRTIPENTAAGVNIGEPVAATDADNDTLTYSKGWVDGIAFSIDTATGQIRTKAPLDYETKNIYHFNVFVDDGNGGRDVILVTINVTDVDETSANNAPSFTDGDSTTRTVAENTAAGTNIGTAIVATDADGDTLTYTLGGTDAASFSIVSTSGQLQRRAALDYETKSSYAVTVSVSDGNGGSDSISVTVSVTDVNETPSFPTETATRSITENTASGQTFGDPFQATDPDSDDTLTYSLHRGDAAAFRINPTTGQLRTHAPLDFETKKVYNNLAIRATDSNGKFDAIFVTVNVTDVNEKPSFPTETATRSIAENTASGTNIGDPFQATDPDSGDTLTYSLHRGDAGVFRINARTGQLRTHTALDFETKKVYNNLAIRATDSKGNFDAIFVTVNVTDVNENRAPAFSDGASTTRSVAENTASGVNIGSAISAADPDTGDTLTYTLGGTDAASFRIVSTSGQLQTNAALDYETKSSYSVSVSVSDGNGGSDSIAVTINVTDVNENRAPAFTDGTNTTRSIAENTASGVNIGSPISAADPDTGNTLTYTLGGTDAASFSIVSTSGQLQTKAALDYETKSSYSVSVSVSDGNGGSDSIAVTINVTDVNENRAPAFSDGASTTRSIAENTSSGTNIGTVIAATDPDTDDTLTYTLGGTDASAFSIVSTSGQLQTKTALDYETKSSYSVSVSVSDGNGGSDSITVTINVTDINENRAPVFTDGTNTTRSIAENTASGVDIGTAIAATDPDTEDTLTCTLGGRDAASFSIVSTSGQLQTKEALDYETKTSYSVTITASDGDLTDSIEVTISVTDVNEKPSFPTETATRSIAENTPRGTNIGVPFQATDPDTGDTLTYSLHRGDAAAFRIDPSTGQLRTHAALNFETKKVYNNLAIRATDSKGKFDAIFVTINVTDVNEKPNFPTETATRSVAEKTASGEAFGDPFQATDPDSDDTLTYSLHRGDAAAFRINPTTGQLRTHAALDFETKKVYNNLVIRATDSNGKFDAIFVTINITKVDENRAPTFTDGSSTKRSVAENTASGANIGTAIAATDADNDTLTYTLGGTDAAAFSIVSTSGQLQTSAVLDYEVQNSYSVTVSISDSNSGTDSIAVTINVTDENDPPVFKDGDTVARAVLEDDTRIEGELVGLPVTATDQDGDTVTYSLSGTDADLFKIDSATGDTNLGQLRTAGTAIDSETKPTCTVVITASDGTLTDTITVTINITDTNDPPMFTAGDSTTRAIAENTPANTNIGEPLAVTDPDTGDRHFWDFFDTNTTFDINTKTGQLKIGKVLDFETKNAYTFKIFVADFAGETDLIDVTVNVTDVNDAPVFTEGATTTRTIAENTAAGQNIGTPVAATDQDRDGEGNAKDTLTYSLSGTDADSFSIVSTSGQLQTKADLDRETKNAYSVTVSVSDGNSGTDSIDVTINVTNVNEAPVFADGDRTTRSVPEDAIILDNIGSPVSATDPDGDRLTYTLGGTDAASFNIDSTNGQLKAKAVLDFETKTTYTVTITVSDGNGGTDSIDVTINITNANDPPVFNEGERTTRAVAENTPFGIDFGDPIAATDPDTATGDTLFYMLRYVEGDKTFFTINSATGQLSTKVPLDFERRSSYEFEVDVVDQKGPAPYNVIASAADVITVTVNVIDVNDAPVFTEGATTTRTIAENTAAGQNIGTPVAATDQDRDGEGNAKDTLTYNLGGTDADAFSIVSTSGQLQTKAALDSEAKNAYSVTVSVSDGNGGTDTIDVTINIKDVDDNNAPVFSDGISTTRAIAENTAADTNIASPVAATDLDNDTLTYSLGGTDAASFSIVSTSGQLQTSAALDYETKASYLVTVSVSDGNGGSDSISVTINVTNIDETPITPLSERTPLVRDAIVRAAGVNSAADVTAAHLAAITSLDLQYTGITSVKAGDFSGLTALTALRLRGNNVISDISALEGLTNLTFLELSYNFISDISVLEHLTELTTLDLNNNAISDVSALEDLTKLTTLDLSNNTISDMSVLEDLTKLTTLDLGNNTISDISVLEHLTKLTMLRLSDTSISDISALADLTKLTWLDLNNNAISDISALADLTKLTMLRLSDTSISDISALADLTELTTLDLKNNAISDISALENLTSLASLTLLGNPISDYGPLRRLVAAIEAAGGSLTLDITIPEAAAAPSTHLSPMLPDNTALLTNFPNPFNPETWIPYQLAKPAEVTLTIYDVRGRAVRTLRLGYQPAGLYRNRSKAAHWDGRNQLGEKVATGIYFYTLKAGDYIATRKLLIRK